MSQNWTEKFKQVPKSKRPDFQVRHSRGEDRAYTGKTVCTLSYINKDKRPRTIVGTSNVSIRETAPATKKMGFRIATERAFKAWFKAMEPKD